MKPYFSIGEMAKQQNISRQTLILYDRMGLFRPAYVDPDNGYRYYSAAQLDTLDAICMMKRIGFSLEEIKAHMKDYHMDTSIAALEKQIAVMDRQIEQLQMIRSRAEHRRQQLVQIASLRNGGERVTEEAAQSQHLLLQEVAPPYSLEAVSLATKQCFVRSFRSKLPVYFLSGAIVPLERILQGRYTEASHVFLPIEKTEGTSGVIHLPQGRCVCTYHTGDYPSIGRAYERILNYCRQNRLEIISDSYEFAINDSLSTGDENEYVTKIQFYVHAKEDTSPQKL